MRSREGQGDRVSEVAAIGARTRVSGFALAGARVYPAETPDQVLQAWISMPETVAVVILTQEAADAVGTERILPRGPLTVVMPE